MLEDRTMEFVKAFDEDDDFMVYEMASEKCTEKNVTDVEKILGVKFPNEYKAHILGDVAGGVFVEVIEEIWPRKRGGGAAWMFFSGLHTFTPSKDSDDWMRLEVVGNDFMKETGLKAVPILKILCDADVYCVNENGEIVQFCHEGFALTKVNMNFWELLDRELKALNERKEMMKKEMKI